MPKTILISGHPNLAQSNANQSIINDVQSAIDDLEVRALDQLYPDYQIDIALEQQKLIEADSIILQFPFYWYSMPALLKKWIDDVFAYDFAYGSNGNKLKGKKLVLSFTVGGPEDSYKASGFNTFEISELLKPLVQMANLTGLNLQPVICTHQLVYIENVYNTLEAVQTRSSDHAQRLITQLKTMTSQAA